MDWHRFLNRVERMHATTTDAELRSEWQALIAEVDENDKPYHLALAVDEFESRRGDRPRSDFHILDHGCGPASALVWLAAIGFTNSRGVDVGGDFEAQNRWARVALGHNNDCFAIYDGKELPIADRSIDAIISHQVLEHVPEAQFESYYAEQGRVLVDGGIVLAQVPHKLVPYDSHSRTWVLHMLPKAIAESLMKAAGREWPDHLHLRWPSTHVSMSKRFIGPVINHSAKRLVELTTMKYYDGPRGMRTFIGSLCRVPGVGRLFARVLSSFVLMETVATRCRPDSSR
ncbi:class I SAM-dependent methyltransferase [Tardiphaga alba]|uniref:Class I SAM-dependent methyltransferase n=1 Tax=Tardiphaga alba TaxID=340268 RepID=A0ABX8A608_9BRAD|nr:class I SAM-dependent methyltransferase [Tardiphaga alba]QUS39129.1 class I SAM-dependent methyltransferase [Tardiphaga alba]